MRIRWISPAAGRPQPMHSAPRPMTAAATQLKPRNGKPLRITTIDFIWNIVGCLGLLGLFGL